MKQGRKVSGGKYHKFRKKKFYEKEGQPRQVSLKARKTKKIRGRGGNVRTVLLNEDSVNLVVKGKTQRATIKNVLETPQNVFLARQNKLTKGAIIETSLGRARITNRPSQEGCVNAVLIEG